MKWLVTYPEDGPSLAVYSRWMEGGGISPAWIDGSWEVPASIEPYAALLLPGGGDVNPALYGDVSRHPETYDVIHERDAVEMYLIRRFLEAGKPVLGICRGIQILNVFFGGRLLQHVPDLIDEKAECHRKRDSYDAIHALKWETTSRLATALGRAGETNSAHHQAIDPSALGFGLRVSAQSACGVIEAVESVDPRRRVYAVQWHPERLPPAHPASRNLLEYWKSICRL